MKRCIVPLFLFFLLMPPHLGAESLPAINGLSEIAAREYLRARVQKKVTHWEKDAWALVNLERLSGHEAEALNILSKCGLFCAVNNTKNTEWLVSKKWACSKQGSLEICKK